MTTKAELMEAMGDLIEVLDRLDGLTDKYTEDKISLWTDVRFRYKTDGAEYKLSPGETIRFLTGLWG